MRPDTGGRRSMDHEQNQLRNCASFTECDVDAAIKAICCGAITGFVSRRIFWVQPSCYITMQHPQLFFALASAGGSGSLMGAPGWLV